MCEISEASTLGLGLSHPLFDGYLAIYIYIYIYFFFFLVNLLGCEADYHLNLGPRLEINGAILQLHPYAYISWCLVKKEINSPVIKFRNLDYAGPHIMKEDVTHQMWFTIYCDTNKLQ
jgi:hypothetical protein